MSRTPQWIQDRPGEFFAWSEFLITRRSDIQTLPDLAGQRAIVGLCTNTLDPLRRAVGGPVHLTSGWRSLAVNTAIGGARGSLHTKGQAADLKTRGLSAFDIVRLVLKEGIPFDKIIAYETSLGGHVHVSWVSAAKNRKRALVCFRDDDGNKAYRLWTR